VTDMTIEQLGSIGEFVGAFATIATLLFLAAQIRQNTKMVRSASITAHAEGIQSASALLANNPELCDLYYKGLEFPDSLTDSERRRFYITIGTYINCLSHAAQMASEGSLPPDLAHQYAAQLEWLVCQPGFQLWFRHWGHIMPRQFLQTVKHAMERGRAAGQLGIFTEGQANARHPAAPTEPGRP
jgi:hypothetical protein